MKPESLHEGWLRFERSEPSKCRDSGGSALVPRIATPDTQFPVSLTRRL